MADDSIGSLVAQLLAALVLGGMLGAQRERAGKPAGLRTHMLVALGSALFVLVARDSGMNLSEVSRAIQGIAGGGGFIGGGAILKLSSQEEVRGLTTETSVWLTTAVGVTVGLGNVSLATVAACSLYIVLAVIGKLEQWLERGCQHWNEQGDQAKS